MGTWLRRQKNLIEFTLFAIEEKGEKCRAGVCLHGGGLFPGVRGLFHSGDRAGGLHCPRRSARHDRAEDDCGETGSDSPSHIERIRKVGNPVHERSPWGYYYDPVVGRIIP